MFNVFAALYASHEARDVVELPLAVRHASEEPEREGGSAKPKKVNFPHSIIYRNLVELGYRKHVPNRVEDPELFELFHEAAENAVDAIHRAGVMHGDLYA